MSDPFARDAFAGRHVLVTGGARGLGLEIARQFGLHGARVTIVDRDPQALEHAAAALREEGVLVAGHHLDVGDRDAVFATVARLEAEHPVDTLVNNAGIASESPFLSIETAEWRRVLDVNLTGMFHVGQAVARRMAARKSGVVLNMASKNGQDGEAGYAHYNASKGGVVMLTRTMALELAHLGVRVNAVAPGYIQTPMSQEIDRPEFVRDFVDRYIPVGRPGQVADVAGVFLFLASDAAAFITGQVFVVDGGQLAGQKPGPELLRRLGLTRSDG